MKRARRDVRETAGCIDFDAALEAYLEGSDPERLLRAAGRIIDCKLPIDPKHADTISRLTDHLDIEIETYDDAGRAVRHWFALMGEDSARH
jgi:hypothetical protein